MIASVRRAAKILVVVGLGACWRTAAPPAAGPASEALDPTAAPSAISLVTSAVVMDACPDQKRIRNRQATQEIEELVGPCTKVPGGAAHFSATLLPGGRIALASPSGDRDDGVVPTCVLQQANQLRHRLRLTKPCKFDVKLEERVAGS
jgi:hypothetical protein